MSWVAGATPKPRAGSNDGVYSDRNSERSRDLVGARVVCEAQRDEKADLTALLFFSCDAGGLLCARGRWTSHGGCSDGAASWYIDSWRSRRHGSSVRRRGDLYGGFVVGA